jgi:hypothetical protein
VDLNPEIFQANFGSNCPQMNGQFYEWTALVQCQFPL